MATNVLRPPLSSRKPQTRRAVRTRSAARRGNAAGRRFRMQPLSKQAKQGLSVFLIAGLATGLLFGGLLLLLFLPVDLSTLLPQAPNPAAQRAYVTRVLENYSRTQNLAQAENDLAAVDPQQVAGALAALQQTTADPQSQQQLAALSAALQVRPAQSSLTDTLLAEPVFILGLVLSLVPLLGAIAVVAGPALLRRNRPDTEDGRRKNADREADERLDGVPPPTSGSSKTSAATGEALPELRGAAGKSDAAEPDTGEKKESPLDKPEEENNPDLALGNLANVFEDDEPTNNYLETLARSLGEVEITELSLTIGDSLQRLKDVNHGDSKRIPQGGAPA